MGNGRGKDRQSPCAVKALVATVKGEKEGERTFRRRGIVNTSRRWKWDRIEGHHKMDEKKTRSDGAGVQM
jgi:hypothetical protein